MFRDLLPVVAAGLAPFAVLILIVLGTAFSLVAWQPPIQQTIQFGTPGSENGITALASDQTGVYAAGFVGYRNATPTYLFLNKYNLNGGEVWSDHFDNPYLSQAYGVAVATTGVYVVGTTNESSYLREYDLNGNRIWNDLFGNWSATSISVSPTAVYVGGGFNMTQYVVKDFTLNGTLVWTHLFGAGTGKTYVHSSLDGVYVIGEGGGPQKYGLNGTLLWARSCSCEATGIASDSTSTYVVGSAQTATGLSDGFLTKYDSSGGKLWSRSFSAQGLNSVRKVEAAADSSGIYLTETTTEPRSFVMKYDINGNLMWSLQLPLTTGLGAAPSDAISLGGSAIYVGGDSEAAVLDVVFLTILDKSSSLIFFGVNPPFSFGILGVLVAAAITSVLWLRRRWTRTHRPPSKSSMLQSRNIPSDMSASG